MYYSPYQGQQPVRNSFHEMIISAEGNVFVTPNIAVAELGVVTEGETLTTTQQENANRMQQVIEALLELGVLEEDIQTVQYSIQPQYDYVDGAQEFRGYQVTNMIAVTTRETEGVGEVIDTAVRNGANRVSSVRFQVENPNDYYDQALQMALINGTEKAKTIAETISVNLYPKPIQIVEKTEKVEAPIVYQTYSLSDSTTPIEPGQLEVNAKVEMKFQYFT